MASKPVVYCGNEENPPEGYDRHGTRYECLRKGIGVGVHMKDKNASPILSDYEVRKLAKRLHITILNKERAELLREISVVLERLG